MVKKSAKKKPVLKSNFSIKIDSCFFQNSIWEISFGELFEENYGDMLLLLNYEGDIWASSDKFHSGEKIGKWSIEKKSLFITIENIPEELNETFVKGSYKTSFISLGPKIAKVIQRKRKQLVDVLYESFPWSPYNLGLRFNGIGRLDRWRFYLKLKEIQKRTPAPIKCPENCFLNNFLSEYSRFKHFPHSTDLIFKEPYYFFVDVETNGLPAHFRDPKVFPEDYPEIIQIATLYCDSLGKRIGGATKYIMPKGWRIKDDVKTILGINESKMMANGFYLNHWSYLTQDEQYIQFNVGNGSFEDHLNPLFGPLSELDISYVVGHNIEYDLNCLEALYYRCLDKPEFKDFVIEYKKEFLKHLPDLKRICTMKSTTEYCGIQTKKGYKYPKLEELYWTLFQEDLPQAHDASKDIFNTAKCYWKLIDLGYPIILNEENEIENSSNVERIKIIDLNLTGENEGYVKYRIYIGNILVANGIAFCKDIDGVEIDDDDFLVGNMRLSNNSETII